jgi:hypothetical protein
MNKQIETSVHGNKPFRKLVLAPWGPLSRNDTVTVDADIYDPLQPGDHVCIDLKSGTLGFPWYVVRSCKDNAP